MTSKPQAYEYASASAIVGSVRRARLSDMIEVVVVDELPATLPLLPGEAEMVWLLLGPELAAILDV